MYAHPIYCENCKEDACTLRTELPTYDVVLKPGYFVSRTDVYGRRKDCCICSFNLKIKEEAEYKARPLPNGGLDMIRNHYNDSMISDRADFNFHEHDFEVCGGVYFGAGKEKTGVKFYIPKETKIFIGNVVALMKRRRRAEPEPIFRVEPHAYFNRIYKNEKHIGFGINETLYAYNMCDDVMHSDEGLYEMFIIKYTDKATKKADGILFAGSQDENWMNFKEGLDCEECLILNKK